MRHQLPGVAPWAHGVCHRAAESTCVASAPARSNSPSSSLPSTLSTCSPSSRSTSLSVSAKGRSAVRTHVLRRVLAARAAPCRALPRLAAPCRAAHNRRPAPRVHGRLTLSGAETTWTSTATSSTRAQWVRMTAVASQTLASYAWCAAQRCHSTHLHPHLDRSTAPTCPA